MERTSSRCRRTSAPEAGFSAIELTVTMGVLLIVLGAMLGIFESVQRSQAFVANRSETLDGLRVAMDRMTKEIRQATSIDTSSGTGLLAMTTYVGGVSKQVTYQASGATLTRREGSAAAVPIQGDLASGVLFTYTPAVAGAQVVAVDLKVRPVYRPDTVLELTSEVRLRNVGQS